jgi:hypothetical protein
VAYAGESKAAGNVSDVTSIIIIFSKVFFQNIIFQRDISLKTGFLNKLIISGFFIL